MNARKPDNETLLLRQMSEGNQNAFATIFHFYAPSLGEYAISILGNKEIAEEIIQDVFLQVWRRRASVQTIEEFGSYLFIATRNATINEIRKIAAEIKNRRSYKEWIICSAEETVPEGKSDFIPIIDQAIENLPSRQQQVYQLAKREGLSYKDIGRQMNINPTTVKRYMYIATQAISRFVKSHADRSFLLFMLLAFR